MTGKQKQLIEKVSAQNIDWSFDADANKLRIDLPKRVLIIAAKGNSHSLMIISKGYGAYSKTTWNEISDILERAGA
jgi:hypothetical protein